MSNGPEDDRGEDENEWKIECDACDGTGVIDDDDDESGDCPECGGTGWF